MGYGCRCTCDGPVALDNIPLPAYYTLHVDCNRTDSYTENGSVLHPYKVLQAALTQAQTLLDVPGIGFENDVVSVDVIVAAGYYYRP